MVRVGAGAAECVGAGAVLRVAAGAVLRAGDGAVVCADDGVAEGDWTGVELSVGDRDSEPVAVGYVVEEPVWLSVGVTDGVALGVDDALAAAGFTSVTATVPAAAPITSGTVSAIAVAPADLLDWLDWLDWPGRTGRCGLLRRAISASPFPARDTSERRRPQVPRHRRSLLPNAARNDGASPSTAAGPEMVPPDSPEPRESPLRPW